MATKVHALLLTLSGKEKPWTSIREEFKLNLFSTWVLLLYSYVRLCVNYFQLFAIIYSFVLLEPFIYYTFCNLWFNIVNMIIVFLCNVSPLLCKGETSRVIWFSVHVSICMCMVVSVTNLCRRYFIKYFTNGFQIRICGDQRQNLRRCPLLVILPQNSRS